jgi:undecaprenyl-phosphate 4-deoxy-4-formamido-L-arabinose transferase
VGSVAEIPVRHHRRAAGSSRYNLLGRLRLAADLVTGFSLLPMRLILLAGMLLVLLGCVCGLYVGLEGLRGVPSSMTLVLTAVFCFVGGLQLLALGGIGEYVGRTCLEVWQRPRYVIREIWE